MEAFDFDSFSRAQANRALAEALLVEGLEEYQSLDASKRYLVQSTISALASLRIVASFYEKTMEQVTYGDLARFYADQD